MDTEQRDALVFDFVDHLLDDVESGEIRPLHEYLRRFPGCEEDVAREYFAMLKVPEDEADEELRVGPYRLLRRLGRGGQGVVWLAEDARIDRRVALKMLSTPLGGVPEAKRERLRREAELVSRLEHPDLCAVYDADLTGEVPYVAMRLVEGRTLAAVLAEARSGAAPGVDPTEGGPAGIDARATLPVRPSTPEEVAVLCAWFEQAARALHAAHEAGVVHRDVKPGNLMVTPEGRPVVLDFGLARTLAHDDATLTATGEVFGTLAYVAPERLGRGAGRAPDRRVDVYALGVTLHEALTLRCPYAADTPEELLEVVLRGEAPSTRRDDPSLPRDLDAVCLTAMAPEPSRRYATAEAFAEDLAAVREGRPVAARPRSASTRLLRRASRHPWTAGVAAALVLVTAAAVALGEGWRDEAAAHERSHEDHVLAHAAFLRLRDAHREARVPDPADEAVVARFIPPDATLERTLILGSPLSRDAAELFVRYAADATRGTDDAVEARAPRGRIVDATPTFVLAGAASDTPRALALRIEQPGTGVPPRVRRIEWPAGADSASWTAEDPLAAGHGRWTVFAIGPDDMVPDDATPLASAVFERVDAAHVDALLADVEPTGDPTLDAELRALALLRDGLGAPARDLLADAPRVDDTPARARRLLLEAWAAGLLGERSRVATLRADWLALRGADGG